MLLIPTNIRTEIEAHAEQGYPHEVVGILAGNSTVNTVQVLRSLVNERGDTHNRYQVSALALYRATQALESEGWDILGYYHSHRSHHNTLIMTESMLCPIFLCHRVDSKWNGRYHTVLEIV